MTTPNDAYYLSLEEPQRSCLEALRSLILEQDEQIREEWKWSMPCFTYGGKMLCFIRNDPKTNMPYILFVEGRRLDFPGLEKGRRTRMKIFPVDPERDIPVGQIRPILSAAIGLV